MDNLAYEEEYKKEIINGEIILMSPYPSINHNRIIKNITTIFNNYLENKDCEVFTDGVEVHFSNKDILVPDMTVVCNSKIIKQKGIYGAPSLVVEVLSPSTAERDRGYKKDLYEKYGVKEYWIINPKDFSIEIYYLKNGRYQINSIFYKYSKEDLEEMTEEEKRKIKTEFKCSLFEDLIIKVNKIFHKVI